ncbi:hypothetical protein L3N51_02416 [Metallosphaera sp. J1]|uniref:MFS transporter n=1 Tax=Metallosphaera javensis (ex Hofmann et al. 2022) TaxID=99938 RepID=UPI001EDF8483|nr:MFS transporter [Metallosphaera javensis (ex Hofmann et al. 2022)]MCG3110119.1 hypothetical protein [Metallosphaera javensis (ex Hofmann et al. 2022)]
MNHVTKLAFSGGIRSLTSSLIWPYIGFGLYRYLGLSLVQVGQFYLTQLVISSIAYVIGGYLTDYLGRRLVMTLATSLSSLVLTLAFFLNTAGVVGMVLLQSGFSSIYAVANMASVGDMGGNFKQLVRSFSVIRVGINAGWAIGPAIGGVLLGEIGFKPLLLLGGVLSVVAIPFVYSLPDHKGRVKFFFPSRKFTLFLIPTLLTFTVMGQLGFPLVTYYSGLGIAVWQVGLLYAVNGGLIIFLQTWIGERISGNYRRWIAVGMTIYSLSYGVVFLVNDFWEALLDVVGITIAEMIVSPLSQSISTSLAEGEARGTYSGIYGLVTSMGRTLGSSMSAFLLTRGGEVAWPTVGGIGLASAILYLALI